MEGDGVEADGNARGDGSSSRTGADEARLGCRAFAADGGVVDSLRTSAATHDTTGGVAIKIREAAAVARLGGEVRIARAGGPAAAAACAPTPLPPCWGGTVVRLQQ